MRNHQPFVIFSAVFLALTGAGLLLGENAPTTPARISRWFNPMTLSGEVLPVSGTGPVLFRFKRSTSVSQTTALAEWDYTYPDGKLAVRERTSYDAEGLTAYEFDQLQTGERGSARLIRDPQSPSKSRIEFEYRKGPNTETKRSSERLQPNTIAGDMVGMFLAAHWEELLAGRTLKTRYIVVERTETIGFSFWKTGESVSRRGPLACWRLPSDTAKRNAATRTTPLHTHDVRRGLRLQWRCTLGLLRKYRSLRRKGL